MDAPERGPDPLIGRLLDRRYRILSRVARGGMASVYEATDIRLDRTVAVKVMHPGLGDDDEFAQRFVREARAAARLNHPNVVGVYDQGEEDETIFLVMEYVPGHTLRDVIRKEAPMVPRQALTLIEPIVSALAAAHRAQLIHRDVKPENVLIADASPHHSGGHVKVADFGLAKAVSADTQHTATGGVLIGTVSYLAPELVVDGRADTRADVYAVGVVLFELLTGTKPHEGESPIQVAYKHVHNDVPAPSELQPGIPDYVDALVARATCRDREQRPADASVLLHQVHQVAHALREGVASDPDLAADLRPRTPAQTDEFPGPEDTQPDPFEGAVITHEVVEPGAAAEHAETSHDFTSALDLAHGGPRPTVAPPATQAAPPAADHWIEPVGPVALAPRKRSVKGPIMFVLALLLAVGVGVGAWWFGAGRYTSTPEVTGQTEAQATAALKKAGFTVKVGEPDYSEDVEKDLVLNTDPKPGARVVAGGTVTLVLSLGPERYDVPKLRGLTEDAAQDALAEVKLTFGKSTQEWSEKIPEGQVIRSEPNKGETVKPDTVVDLVISQGRKPIEIKDFTGKSFARAKAVLEQKKLSVSVSSEQYSDSVKQGRVISQDPTAGPLFRGDTVTFVVSKGPELVEVPSTRGMGVEEAISKLEALGFNVDTAQDSSYIGLGYVFTSDPSPGSEVPKGSTITLYLL